MFKVLMVFVLISYFILTQLAWSVTEVWVQRYNGPGNDEDVAIALAVGAFCNIYVTGWSHNGTNLDYLTIKYLPDGTIAPNFWPARFNGSGNGTDKASAIAIDGAGNVYVTGWSHNGANYDYATIKYLPDGTPDPFWSPAAIYNGPANSDDYASAIAVDGSGNVYVTGYSMGSGTGLDYATIKYSPTGVIALGWPVRYDGPRNANDYATAIAVDGSGNVYVTGTSLGGATVNLDYATIKYDPIGTIVPGWAPAIMYNGPLDGNDIATALVLDGSGNVYVTGRSYGGASSGWDYATIKYLPNGATDPPWAPALRYNDPANGFDMANALVLDNSGNLYVTGTSYGGISVGFDYATIKYLPNGTTDPLWVPPVRYDGLAHGNDSVTAMALDHPGNIYVTGYSSGSGTGLDYATIKYLPTGVTDPGWAPAVIYDGPAKASDRAYDIALNCWDNVYVTGASTGSGTFEDYATVKYVEIPFVCGDCDASSTLGVSDLVCLINYLFKGGHKPNPLQSVDINCDCRVSVSDIVTLVNYLFKGGALPCCC